MIAGKSSERERRGSKGAAIGAAAPRAALLLASVALALALAALAGCGGSPAAKPYEGKWVEEQGNGSIELVPGGKLRVWNAKGVLSEGSWKETTPGRLALVRDGDARTADYEMDGAFLLLGMDGARIRFRR